jgi:hypothetical protein
MIMIGSSELSKLYQRYLLSNDEKMSFDDFSERIVTDKDFNNLITKDE